jgi:N-acetylmuramoyl-L-alanine amidase
MVRIFLSAGHGAGDPGAVAGGTTEDEELTKTRDAAVKEMRSRGLDVLWVPDTLDLKPTINWINDHSRRGDVALEIHADAFSNTNVRGASIYYIDSNEQRRADAELVLQALLKAVPDCLLVELNQILPPGSVVWVSVAKLISPLCSWSWGFSQIHRTAPYYKRNVRILLAQ